ncbi:endothelin-converting enzyme homolog isoform X2 [Palaemon carinicauda]|uniref:endothelin-converting enzyme homolog isoform X2 n=1 Tax=Palaemon carinicauda TaxID=392227 RepID=UPI0035B637B7
MTGVTKKTSCALTTVAISFIIVIVILCLVPDPCKNDPRPECKRSKQSWYLGDSTLLQTNSTETPTVQQNTSTATPSTVQQTTSTATPSTTVQQTTSTETPSTAQQTTSTATPSTVQQATSTATPSTVQQTTSTETPSTAQQTTSTATPSTTVKTTSLTTMKPTSPQTQTTSSSTVTISSSTSSISSTQNSTLLDTDATIFSTDISNSSVFIDSDENVTTPVSDMTDTTNILVTLENDTSTTDLTNMTSEFERDGKTTEMTTIEYETATTKNATSSVIETVNTTELSTTMTDKTSTEIEVYTTETTKATTVSTTDTYSSVGVCDTEVCREVSRRMLDMMDPKDIDPCDDFYQYSCGGVLDDPFLKPEDPQLFADNIIKEALTYSDKDDEDLKELFVMYDSCLNYTNLYEEERLEKAREVFKEIDFNSKDFDLGDVLAKMMKMHFTPFFDIGVDFSNNTDDQELTLKIALPFKSAFTNERAMDVCLKIFKEREDEAKHKKETFDIDSQYEAYVYCTKQGSGLQARTKSIERNMKYLNQLHVIEDSTISILQNMLEKMAKEIPPIAQIRRELIHMDYEEFSLTEIDDGLVFGKLPFNMRNIIQELLGVLIHEPNVFTIHVYSRDVLKNLFVTIAEIYDSQKPLMQSIMQLLWVEHIYDNLITPLDGPAGSQNYCLNIVTKFMDDYVSYLYLKQMTERNTVESQMERMIRITYDLMKSQVEDSMLESRNDFINKLDMMSGEFANLNEAKTALKNNKNDIKISVAENNFAENYIRLMKYDRERLHKTLDDDPSDYRPLWSLLQSPYKNRGVTSYPLNKFLIPHGAMSPPYYYEGAPAYINYAGMGHTIAHEILHAFDSTGMKFNGEDNSWMKNDQTLIKNKKCLEQQLINGSTNGLLKLQPYLHLDEVLADVAAPNLAWNAYTKDLLHTSRVYRRRRSAKSVSAALLSGSPAAETIHTSLSDEVLIHWENKTIQQIYFIKIAQNQCSSTRGLNIQRDIENVHLPPKLRVNLQLGNNQMFMKAFNCDKKSNPKMRPHGGICFYNPTGREEERSQEPSAVTA